MTLTPEKITELRAAYGTNLLLIEVDGLEVVCKPVGLKEYRAFKATTLGPGGNHVLASEELIFSALVYPAPEVVRAYLDRRPLALTKIGDELVDHNGTMATWTSQGVDASGHETFTCDDLTVTLAPVSGAAGRLYQQRIDSATDRATAAEWLLQQVIVSPTYRDLEAKLHGRPFLLDRLAIPVTERAGRAVEVRAKKL